MRDPTSSGPSSGSKPRRPRRGFSLDSGLILGIILVAIGLSALIIKGFKERTESDEYLAQLASFDPHFNGGFPQYDINTVTKEQLAELPMMTEEILNGILQRREEKPFVMTEELLCGRVGPETWSRAAACEPLC